MKSLFVTIYGLVCLSAGAGASLYLHSHRPPKLVAGWMMIECRELLGAGFIYSDGQVEAVTSTDRGNYSSFKDVAEAFNKIPESGQFVMQSCPEGTSTTKFPSGNEKPVAGAF